MSFKSFIKSKIFFRNLGAAVALTMIIFLVVLLSLKRYTYHGESFPVPNLRGMNLENAISVINENDLRYEIMDSIYQKNGLPGTIYDQIPVPDFHVKVKRTVFLTIYARNPEQVKMPKLTDVSLRQAMNLMIESGLNIGNIKYIPSDYPDLVLEQNIPIGNMISKGSNINLVVGQGGVREKATVPNLMGVTLEQAKAELGSVLLKPGSVIYNEAITNPEDSAKVKVWKQVPIVNTKIEIGKTIDLWMTLDSTLIQIPDTIEDPATIIPEIIDFE